MTNVDEFGFAGDLSEEELAAARKAAEGRKCPDCGYPEDSFKCASFKVKGINGHTIVSLETVKPKATSRAKAGK